MKQKCKVKCLGLKSTNSIDYHNNGFRLGILSKLTIMLCICSIDAYEGGKS